MGVTSPPVKHQYGCSLAKKFLPWTFYALLPILLLHLYLYPPALALQSHVYNNIAHLFDPIRILPPPSSTSSSSLLFPLPNPPSKGVESEGEQENGAHTQCNFADGEWVRDKRDPLYNSSCATIKHGQNCMAHGRPDTDYLHWRWKPRHCPLPRFDPNAFLGLLENRHLAFVGDSMARNQLESLLCMLATATSPTLVYNKDDDNKFRRWHFPSHNATISVYWSPFLVKGDEKSTGNNHNRLQLDSVDEKWASELDQIDVVVLSVGHWYLHPAVYFEKGEVLGCHACQGNHTEVGFYGVFGKAVRTALKAVVDRGRGSGVEAVVATFSPAHFEGEWDKAGACPKTRPFEEGERAVEGMEAEMRKAAVEEVAAAAAAASGGGGMGMRVEALDVTKLAAMRPDGHPGPYMHPFPFANGASQRMQNDCVHWCLPGPVDTWNEILSELLKGR